MRKFTILLISLLCLLLTNCTTLNKPTIIKSNNNRTYKYVFINRNNSQSTSLVNIYPNLLTYESNNNDQNDYIAGLLAKNGFIILPEIKPELSEETLIVFFGKSGRRYLAGGLAGYTTEITIQFISARNFELVISCTSEGIGWSEEDDIRKAIDRAIPEIINELNHASK